MLTISLRNAHPPTCSWKLPGLASAKLSDFICKPTAHLRFTLIIPNPPAGICSLFNASIPLSLSLSLYALARVFLTLPLPIHIFMCLQLPLLSLAMFLHDVDDDDDDDCVARLYTKSRECLYSRSFVGCSLLVYLS